MGCDWNAEGRFTDGAVQDLIMQLSDFEDAVFGLKQ